MNIVIVICCVFLSLLIWCVAFNRCILRGTFNEWWRRFGIRTNWLIPDFKIALLVVAGWRARVGRFTIRTGWWWRPLAKAAGNNRIDKGEKASNQCMKLRRCCRGRVGATTVHRSASDGGM